MLYQFVNIIVGSDKIPIVSGKFNDIEEDRVGSICQCNFWWWMSLHLLLQTCTFFKRLWRHLFQPKMWKVPIVLQWIISSIYTKHIKQRKKIIWFIENDMLQSEQVLLVRCYFTIRVRVLISAVTWTLRIEPQEPLMRHLFRNECKHWIPYYMKYKGY